jgi:hypothetical protein
MTKPIKTTTEVTPAELIDSRLPDTAPVMGKVALESVGGNSEFYDDIVSEHTMLTPSGEPIISGEQFVNRATELGFGNGKRGTYHNKDSFLYIKSCHEINDVDNVDAALLVARQLTEKGAIHPDSSWGVIQNERGYQLFVISPRLEPWTLEGAISGQYEDRPLVPEDRPFVPDGGKHIDAWIKSIDERYEPGQELPGDSLAKYLNLHEASHSDNWGWDNDGALYPVDVEVINLRAINHE